MEKTDNIRISSKKTMDSPAFLHKEIPLTEKSIKTVNDARQSIYDVLDGKDDRLVVVVGPCSIHDPKAAMEYAEGLLKLKEQLKDDLIIIMRVYFEKPRTTVGWKGLINDPGLDDSFDINLGLRLARKLLSDLNDKGLPAATEYLDLISPQYVSDLISWGAIGARTTESQGHRELASGLSCPVGFKNGTDGNVQIAIDAINASSRSHNFISITKEGQVSSFRTEGNSHCHIVMRGGARPNYDKESIEDACNNLEKAGLRQKVMIDFSHANSKKEHQRQVDVSKDVGRQIKSGNDQIMGVMIESNLVAGRQDLKNNQDLQYGQSITDACIDFKTTEDVLIDLASCVRARRGE